MTSFNNRLKHRKHTLVHVEQLLVMSEFSISFCKNNFWRYNISRWNENALQYSYHKIGKYEENTRVALNTCVVAVNWGNEIRCYRLMSINNVFKLKLITSINFSSLCSASRGKSLWSIYWSNNGSHYSHQKSYQKCNQKWLTHDVKIDGYVV